MDLRLSEFMYVERRIGGLGKLGEKWVCVWIWVRVRWRKGKERKERKREEKEMKKEMK